jgi:aliphatic nitrilase
LAGSCTEETGMGDAFPTLRLAAAQAAPVFLDRERTVDKACQIILEAGSNGADVIGFPEGFIPAHPLWFHFHAATSPHAMALSQELFANAVVVPSPTTDRLCAAARTAGTWVVIGICEKTATSMGTMYNSLLVIDPDGSIAGVRRKIVPTVGERIVHTAGSGDSVRVFPTTFGAISGLMCGENSNPLLTYAMQALGASVHVASWPSFFNAAVDMQAIADVAGRAIAYQNSAYVINALGAVGEGMIERLPLTDADRDHIRASTERGGTTIYAPGGRPAAGPLGGGEGLLYADADLARIVPRKIVHDYAGDYNRFDIFDLTVHVDPGAPPVRLRRRIDDGPRLERDRMTDGSHPAIRVSRRDPLRLVSGPTVEGIGAEDPAPAPTDRERVITAEDSVDG